MAARAAGPAARAGPRDDCSPPRDPPMPKRHTAAAPRRPWEVPMRALVPVVALATTILGAVPAHALLEPGQPVTDFARAELVGSATGPVRTLADYAGKVLVMFQFGYNCPVCVADGPSFQTQVVQHYQSTAPDDVQVVGADMWNGSNPAVAVFRGQVGATFPLLLQAGTLAAGHLNGWGPWDNYVIASADGIVRFNAAAQGYAHGSRLDVPRMRALIDSLLAGTVGVGDPFPAAPRLALSASPNPFAGGTWLELAGGSLDGARAIVTVHDVAGRRVATLFDGVLGAGRPIFGWDGRNSAGSTAAAGVYLVRVLVGEQVLSARIVRLP